MQRTLSFWWWHFTKNWILKRKAWALCKIVGNFPLMKLTLSLTWPLKLLTKVFSSCNIKVWFWNFMGHVYGNLGDYGDSFFPLFSELLNEQLLLLGEDWEAGIMLIMALHEGRDLVLFPAVILQFKQWHRVGTQQIFEWMNIVYPNFLNKRGRNIYTSRCHLLSWRVVLLASEYQVSNGWAPLVSVMSKSVHDKRSCLHTIRIWGEQTIIWTLKIGNVTSSFCHSWVYKDICRAESSQRCSFKFCSSWSFCQNSLCPAYFERLLTVP